MGQLTDLAEELERRYLPVDGTGVGSGTDPAKVERLVTIRALVNAVGVLEAIDETSDDVDDHRSLMVFYAMMAAAYTLDTALQKLANEVLGERFAEGQGVDLTEFRAVRRLISHPVDLRQTRRDKDRGLAPVGAFVGAGIADPNTGKAGYLVTVVQDGYQWADNKYRPVFPFKYLAVLKQNLERVYLPRLIAALPPIE